MNEEKIKRSRKHTALKVIAVILGLWVLLIRIDFLRFAVSNGYIKPLLTVESIRCNCEEDRAEYGLGYRFDYYRDISRNSDWENPDSSSFWLFGREVYTKGA